MICFAMLSLNSWHHNICIFFAFCFDPTFSLVFYCLFHIGIIFFISVAFPVHFHFEIYTCSYHFNLASSCSTSCYVSYLVYSCFNLPMILMDLIPVAAFFSFFSSLTLKENIPSVPYIPTLLNFGFSSILETICVCYRKRSYDRTAFKYSLLIISVFDQVHHYYRLSLIFIF